MLTGSGRLYTTNSKLKNMPHRPAMRPTEISISPISSGKLAPSVASARNGIDLRIELRFAPVRKLWLKICVTSMMKISGIKTPMMGLLFKLKRSFLPCFSLFITPTSLYSARLQGLFDQIKGDRCK